VVRTRAGSGRLGCLLFLLIVAGIGYFGVNIGEAYIRYYRYRDAMSQSARFASTRSDDQIRRHLAQVADSLGLPEAAQRVIIRRDQSGVTIQAHYIENLELPGTVREFEFNPRVTQK
jgi:hypothetical protein